MRLSLQVSLDVIEFHVTVAYSGLGLISVQYNIRRLCSTKIIIIIIIIIINRSNINWFDPFRYKVVQI